MNHILEKILQLRFARGWTEYDLAKQTDIPQSTISTWYRKNQMPSISSLERLCRGLGIPLSQFFAEGDDPVVLTPPQKELLDLWAALTPDQQQRILHVIEIMLPGNKAE